MNILITGGTGSVGTELGIALVKQGHSLSLLVRDESKAELPFPCELISYNQDHLNVKNPLDCVIHLSGEPIAEKRWSAEQKAKIIDSRGPYAEKLLQQLSKQNCLPKIWVQASAIGYYPESLDPLTEEAAKGTGFLPDACELWEQPAKSLPPETRAVVFRFGVILAKRSGILKKLLPLFKIGLGSAIGSGKQIVSWVHLDDVVKSILFALENQKLSGIYNLTAPEPVTNNVFSQTLAKLLKKPLAPNIPAFVLKMAFGEMSQVALNSQNISSKKLELAGFVFKYPTLEKALLNLLDYEKHPIEFEIYAREWLPKTRPEVFKFFCDEKNLEKLTPDFLNFRVDKKSTKDIQKGTLIDYRLKIHGMPAKWRTLIAEWIPDEKFVDTQLKGPYAKWHHTHLFEDLAGGTLITDRVIYRLPLGILGLAGLPLVKSDVKSIFQYRKKIISQIFKAKEL